MKTSGYREDLRGWPMESGPILSMPPEAKEEDVIAEAERLEALSQVLPIEDVPSVTEIGPAVDERTPDEKLHSAIAEYIAITGNDAEVVVTEALRWIPPEKRMAYLDTAVSAVAAEIDAKAEPIDTGGVVEKPIDIVKEVP